MILTFDTASLNYAAESGEFESFALSVLYLAIYIIRLFCSHDLANSSLFQNVVTT